MSALVPLIGQLSNSEIPCVTEQLLGADNVAVIKSVETSPCRCGCGQAAPSGRKFVSQQHYYYDRTKGLPIDDAEKLVARFRLGVPAMQLARDYSVARATVYRLLRMHDLLSGG